jgi:hypothetical protein
MSMEEIKYTKKHGALWNRIALLSKCTRNKEILYRDHDGISIKLNSLFIYVLTEQHNGKLWSKHKQHKRNKHKHTRKTYII